MEYDSLFDDELKAIASSLNDIKDFLLPNSGADKAKAKMVNLLDWRLTYLFYVYDIGRRKISSEIIYVGGLEGILSEKERDKITSDNMLKEHINTAIYDQNLDITLLNPKFAHLLDSEGGEDLDSIVFDVYVDTEISKEDSSEIKFILSNLGEFRRGIGNFYTNGGLTRDRLFFSFNDSDKYGILYKRDKGDGIAYASSFDTEIRNYDEKIRMLENSDSYKEEQESLYKLINGSLIPDDDELIMLKGLNSILSRYTKSIPLDKEVTIKVYVDGAPMDLAEFLRRYENEIRYSGKVILSDMNPIDIGENRIEFYDDINKTVKRVLPKDKFLKVALAIDKDFKLTGPGDDIYR